MPGAFRAVLFDWRGTLFHDEDDAAWIRASAASIGQTLTTQEVSARVEMLGGAASVGIATLILPPVPNHTPRGLDIVLQLLSSA